MRRNIKEVAEAMSLLAVVSIISIFLIIGTVSGAAPVGPNTLTQASSSRGTDTNTSQQLSVEAGNITELVINDLQITQHWAGFFGNVTGNVELTDSSGNTFYNWSLINPAGEVYASNGSVANWNDIRCIGLNGSSNFGPNQTTLNSMWGMSDGESDAIENTFNRSFTGNFSVGSTVIDSLDNCHLVYTFVDESPQAGDFPEVLLTDNTSVIFTAIINNSINGYKSGTDNHDFQMLVGENGEVQGTTNYFFYVELT